MTAIPTAAALAGSVLARHAGAEVEDPVVLLDEAAEALAVHAGACAGAVVVADGELQAVGAWPSAVRDAVASQWDLAEGPCYDGWVLAAGVDEPDLVQAGHRRWPDAAAPLARLGITSVHVQPIGACDRAVGAVMVGMCGSPADPAQLDQVRDAAAIVHTVAREVLARQRAAQQADHLAVALDTRIVIEQAKGIVAATLGEPLPVAFEALRGFARRNRRSIHAVAAEVVRGDLAPAGLRGPVASAS